MDADDIIATVEDHAAEFRSYGVVSLRLIGSYARGNADEDSDIDFLVEFDDGRGGFDDYIGVLHLLEDLFDREIDLGEPRLLRDELRTEILRGEQVEAEI